MTDQIFYEELRATIRDAIASYLDMYTDEELRELATESLSPPPTLADMTPEERRDCEWMQCDVAGQDGDWLIIDPFDDEDHVHVIGRKGNNRILPAPFITPRPDLPGMEWTGSKKPAPALPDGWRVADHKDNGRVIVTNTTPNRDGYVCYVLPADDYVLGYDWLLCKPYELTYLGTDDTRKETDD